MSAEPEPDVAALIETLPDWACEGCGGSGIQGGWDGIAFADWTCTVCDGSGVKAGVTPPWEGDDDAG